jgi:VanZ family protein
MTDSRSLVRTSPTAGKAPPRPRWEIRLSRIAHGLLIAAWLGAFTATHMPAEHLRGLDVSDKLLHLAGYAGLSSLLWIVLIFRRRPLWRRAAVVLAAMVVYGALDELTQPPFHRSCDIKDWLFDCLGAAVSVCILEGAWRLGKVWVARKREN